MSSSSLLSFNCSFSCSLTFSSLSCLSSCSSSCSSCSVSRIGSYSFSSPPPLPPSLLDFLLPSSAARRYFLSLPGPCSGAFRMSQGVSGGFRRIQEDSGGVRCHHISGYARIFQNSAYLVVVVLVIRILQVLYSDFLSSSPLLKLAKQRGEGEGWSKTFSLAT